MNRRPDRPTIGIKENMSNSKKDWQGLALPLVLIVTGAILLAGDGFGLLSLDRIQNLWPLAVILIGLVGLMPTSLDRIR
jgi:hypothetical protein